ncbi:DUF4123 domain-containing protein [Rodentibacter sp. Ppn85]|uniref:DUF4123 domain-containing protein n=1 Tax=Rodentibacter sp. Ppn85 TaxID=1908525 RepID=UPI000985B579|nr:DUF4123 domain-containing protein [Rodentibacter sp. Ppn85]OOF66667.1 hypothetical protein BKL51_01045 [Rodentibacter sp. Ppn85]
MKKSLWLATAYVQAAHQLDQFVALAAFVQTREEFEQRVQVHFSQHQTYFRFQLAPIPANLFFQRHGRTWLLHQASTLDEDEIRVIPLTDEPSQPAMEENIDYLHCHVIDNIEPLDMQLDRVPELFAPEEVGLLLWPDFPISPNLLDFQNRENPVQFNFPRPQIDKTVLQRHLSQYGNDTPSPTLKVYFVLDANKMPFFSSLSLKAKMKSLFQGKFGEDTAKVAPYLVEVIRDEEHIHSGEMMGLFSLKSALHEFNWEDNLGIFIHSYADFDTVYQHLRKFPMLQDERGKWHFFRFYDPKVLRNYLHIIAKRPAKLHKFFGYDNNIIYAFGSGFENSFHYYTLKALPEETLPAAVVMTDWEMEGFKLLKRKENFQTLARYLKTTYAERLKNCEETVLIQYFTEARKKGYDAEIALTNYALAKYYAVNKQIDFTQIEKELTDNIANTLERSYVLLEFCEK